MKKYNIPFIYFNHNVAFDFRNKNNSNLNKFVLLREHHYQTNKAKFDESLTYDSSDMLEYVNNDMDFYSSDEEEDDTNSNNENIQLTDIIEDVFTNEDIK